jgi:hypothetical protein
MTQESLAMARESWIAGGAAAPSKIPNDKPKASLAEAHRRVRDERTPTEREHLDAGLLRSIEHELWEGALDYLRKGADPGARQGSRSAVAMAARDPWGVELLEALLERGGPTQALENTAFGGSSRDVEIDPASVATMMKNAGAIRLLARHGAFQRPERERNRPAAKAHEPWGVFCDGDCVGESWWRTLEALVEADLPPWGMGARERWGRGTHPSALAFVWTMAVSNAGPVKGLERVERLAPLPEEKKARARARAALMDKNLLGRGDATGFRPEVAPFFAKLDARHEAAELARAIEEDAATALAVNEDLNAASAGVSTRSRETADRGSGGDDTPPASVSARRL